jgi:undecaprenyl-diphosphatase
MEIWEGIILGLLQGLTEFLPVSSSGHLLLFEKFGVGEESMFFNVCVHVGTLVSVLVAMRKKWVPLVKKPLQKTNLFLIVASLPTVVIALLIKVLAPSLLEGQFLALGFVVTTCCLVVCEKVATDKNGTLSVKSSVLSGVFQGIAVLPGVSRSGATITALRLVGVDKKESADFSFLMSIPVILGSLILEIAHLKASNFALETTMILPTILGTITAGISGYFAVKIFLKLVKEKSLLPFAIYTFLLAIVTFLTMTK